VSKKHKMVQNDSDIEILDWAKYIDFLIDTREYTHNYLGLLMLW
jgi:hypothetical protein